MFEIPCQEPVPGLDVKCWDIPTFDIETGHGYLTPSLYVSLIAN
jgi:hypothetical protein